MNLKCHIEISEIDFDLKNYIRTLKLVEYVWREWYRALDKMRCFVDSNWYKHSLRIESGSIFKVGFRLFSYNPFNKVRYISRIATSCNSIYIELNEIPPGFYWIVRCEENWRDEIRGFVFTSSLNLIGLFRLLNWMELPPEFYNFNGVILKDLK